MDYIEINFIYDKVKFEFVGDLLPAYLGEIGYESFIESENGMTAFVQSQVFDKDSLDSTLASFEFCKDITYTENFVKGKNWNEEWEKNFFQPIIIGDDCVIHSSFHKNIPNAKYDILIDPKMSFGTGHHETTSLMIGEILKSDLSGKSLLDMGCGTAVLAILAAKRGASPIVAIDIDEWAFENAKENISLNNEPQIDVKLGGAEQLGSQKFDVILANINRNILLQDMQKYSSCLEKGGLLFMSGFYAKDMSIIEEEAKKHGLQFISHSEKNRWVAVKYEKK